jgi:hypothetical protein
LVDSRVLKSKWVGIEKVREYLKVREHPDKELYPFGKPKLYIFKNCPNLIREIKNYRYKPGSDQPYKKDDHALDELRYYIMSISNQSEKTKDEESYLAKCKNKKLKRGVKSAF